MIKSWKEFVIAVEQMRVCQKEYFRTKAPTAFVLAKKSEKVVDDFITKKCIEWANEKQSDLFKEGAYEAVS